MTDGAVARPVNIRTPWLLLCSSFVLAIFVRSRVKLGATICSTLST